LADRIEKAKAAATAGREAMDSDLEYLVANEEVRVGWVEATAAVAMAAVVEGAMEVGVAKGVAVEAVAGELEEEPEAVGAEEAKEGLEAPREVVRWVASKAVVERAMAVVGVHQADREVAWEAESVQLGVRLDQGAEVKVWAAVAVTISDSTGVHSADWMGMGPLAAAMPELATGVFRGAVRVASTEEGRLAEVVKAAEGKLAEARAVARAGARAAARVVVEMVSWIRRRQTLLWMQTELSTLD